MIIGRHYTPVPGFLDLREAVCTKFKRDNNLDYKPTNIVVSTGAKQSLANAIFALVDEEDEVIIPTPYWVTYSELVKMARGKVVEIHTTPADGFKITPAAIGSRYYFQDKNVPVFISLQSQRCCLYIRKNWKRLAEVFKKYPGITIISDEIYEYINFVGDHQSIAQFPKI